MTTIDGGRGSSFPDLVDALRALVEARRTGALYIISDDNHWAGIAIDDGVIEAVSYRGADGMRAFELLRGAGTLRFKFYEDDVALHGHTWPLPDTTELIELLAAAGPWQEIPPHHEPAGDEAPQAAGADPDSAPEPDPAPEPYLAPGGIDPDPATRNRVVEELVRSVMSEIGEERESPERTMQLDDLGPVAVMLPEPDSSGHDPSPGIRHSSPDPPPRDRRPVTGPHASAPSVAPPGTQGAARRVARALVRDIVEEEATRVLGPIGPVLVREYWRRQPPRNSRDLQLLLVKIAADIGDSAQADAFWRQVSRRILAHSTPRTR